MMFSAAPHENRTKTAPRQRPARYLPLALTFLAGLMCYGLFYRRGAWLSVIGYSVSPAERVMQGEVPYRDFLYNYTPGMLWLNAGLMRAFGTNLLTIHSGLLAFKLATLLVLYWAAKRLMGAWAALVPVALTLSWIGYKYIFGVFPTQYSMLFILLGLLCMLKYNEGERLGFLLLSGLCIGLVFLFKYNVGILLCGCGTLAIAIRELTLNDTPFTRRVFAALKKSFIYWAGFAVALLPLLYYLASNQALRAMLDHFLHHASAYGDERAVRLPPVKWLAPTMIGFMAVIGLAWLIAGKARTYFQAYLIAVFLLATTALLIPGRAFIIKNSAMVFMAYLPIFLFVVVAIFLLWQWHKESGVSGQKSAGRSQLADGRNEESEDQNQGAGEGNANPSSLHPFTSYALAPSSLQPGWWQSNGEVVVVGFFALGAYLEMYPRADYYHLVRALPPTFLLLALVGVKLLPWFGESLSGHLPSNRGALVWSGGVAVALIMLVGFVNTWQPNFDSHFRFIDRTPLAIARGQGILVPAKQAEFVEELTELISRNSSPDDSIFSFGQRGAGFYFLAARRNPTKFVWWRNVGIKRQDRDAVLQMLGEKRARLILLQDSLKDAHVRDAVNANYHRVGAAGGIGVYDRNE